MEPCTFSEIEAAYDRMLASVAASQRIDPICSSSHWIGPVASAFVAASRHRVYAGDAGYVVLLEHATPHGPVLSGFDAVWGFSTPLVGPDAQPLVDALRTVLHRIDFHALTLSGIDVDSPLFAAVQTLDPLGFSETADRCVADLSGGFEQWIARRSSRFRRSLRAAVHRGERAGIEIEHLCPDRESFDATFERLLATEKLSWKTDVRSGLIDTQLGLFTRSMAARFAERGGLRVQFARHEGCDIGYVIGARLDDRYRGFQHSFDQSRPELSVGKLMQFHTISAMAAEGVQSYDMGMHMTYKESYTDRIETTANLIIASP